MAEPDLIVWPAGFDTHQLAGGVTLIDDSANSDARGTVETLKGVTMALGPHQRLVVAVGAIDFSADSAYDSLDAWAALVVRLNIGRLFAVGPAARAVYLSVGREGSWDGESQHCLDIDTAYDEVRACVRPGDVVLVMGSTELALGGLVDALIAGDR